MLWRKDFTMQKPYGKIVSFSRILCLFLLFSFGGLCFETFSGQFFTSVFGVPAWAQMEEDMEQKEEEQELSNEAEGLILDLAAKNDWFKEHVTKSMAIFIGPNLYRGRLLTGGSGLLIVRQKEGWSQKAFYRVEVPDLGFNLGSDTLEIVLLIRSHMGLSSFYAGGFQLGRGLKLADGTTLQQSPLDDLTVDVVSFSRLKSTGTYTNIPLSGIRIIVSEDFNQSFYGTSVEPVEIMHSLSVTDLGFSGLLSALRNPAFCPKEDKSACKTGN
jgi:lipid-binding SYLF domain-containing protein